jgi:hypothetical protein
LADDHTFLDATFWGWLEAVKAERDELEKPVRQMTNELRLKSNGAKRRTRKSSQNIAIRKMKAKPGAVAVSGLAGWLPSFKPEMRSMIS